MKKTTFLLAGIFMVLFCLQTSGGRQQVQGSVSQLPVVVPSQALRMDADFGKISLQFIPNQGQIDGQVTYYVQGQDKTIYFTPEGLTFVLTEQKQQNGKKQPGPGEGNGPESTQRWVMKLDFVDSNKDVEPTGLEKSGAVISYFKGRPEEWKAGLPAYSKIIYRELWPGIDLLYYGTISQMKYEFIIHPGADPSRIRLAYRGADNVSLTKDGQLEVKTVLGGFKDENPVAYQEVSNTRIGVPVIYVLEDAVKVENRVDVPRSIDMSRAERTTHIYGFRVGEYDRSQTLVIDPAMLIYCGYIGGVSEEYGWGIAVDGSGSIYVIGDTLSSEATFPVVVGPDLTQPGNGEGDAFVAKVNAQGTGLEYCGYIGGEHFTEGKGIAVDNAGNAYVIGNTRSSELTFPVVVGPDLTLHGTGSALFVAKVNASGMSLAYCGYIQGEVGGPEGTGIAVDGLGNAYITGYASTPETSPYFFPAKVGPDLTYNGNGDAFVAKVNASGTSLVYCGYIGGSGREVGLGIAVDGAGSAYVTGFTESTPYDFPVAVGPDLTLKGGNDAFVAKVNASGTSLVYCGYIGGSGDDDVGRGIAVDGSQNAYIVGWTNSTQATFPVTAGPDLTQNGGYDFFIAKVASSGASFDYCGFIGGSAYDFGFSIAVDSTGNAYVTGQTSSSESTLPVMGGPDLTYNGGGSDALVAKVGSSGSSLEYCGYVGGDANDLGTGIAASQTGDAYIVGYTGLGFNFPVMTGPDLTFSGFQCDVFVAKIQVAKPTISSITPASASACDPEFVLTVVGSGFVNGATVRWDGGARPTTFVTNSKLEAQIGASDLTVGKTASITVLNADGGLSDAMSFVVSGFMIGSVPTSASVTAGQSATFAIQVTPQIGPYNASVYFSCSGLPSKCTASFSPLNVTPGANVATATLTLTTEASSGSGVGTMFGSTSFLPPAIGLLLSIIVLPFWLNFRKPATNRAVRYWLAPGALICLIIIFATCSTGGKDNPPPYTGTPKGTYQIMLQGSASCLTASTTVTLIVR